MKQTITLMSLVGGALAQISSSCKAIDFDTTTDVLSADCVPRNQSGYISSHLNLNDCFGYDGAKITVSFKSSHTAELLKCILTGLFLSPLITVILGLAVLAAIFT